MAALCGRFAENGCARNAGSSRCQPDFCAISIGAMTRQPTQQSPPRAVNPHFCKSASVKEVGLHNPASSKKVLGRIRNELGKRPHKHRQACITNHLKNASNPCDGIEEPLRDLPGSNGIGGSLDCGNLAELTVDDIMAKLNGSPAARPDSEPASASGKGRQIIPIMPLACVKFPTETIQLQLFESRYRAMFKLIKNSRSQHFGIALTDTTNFSMESVGVLCRLQSLLRLPHQGRLLTSSRALSRFVVKRIVADKPFILAEVELMEDTAPVTLAERSSLAVAETRVWDCLNDVCHLAEKLYGDIGPLPEVISPEVHRWYRHREDPEGIPNVISRDDGAAASGVLRPSTNEGDGADPESTCDISRSEKFSFAVARTIDLTMDQQQELLAMRDTRERLGLVLKTLSEGRGYLAARSSLKDVF